MTATELITGVKPISTECLKIFAPFYEERAKHYVYPRYMQSVCALIDMGKVYYNIIRAKHGNLLVIFKRTMIFGKIGVQMPITPISLSGSAQDEQDAMFAALKLGVSLRVTSEDISRYKIPRNLLSDGTGPFVPVNNEYIYQAQKGSDMIGSKYRKLRYQTKRVMRDNGYSMTDGIEPQTDLLVRLWDERYKQNNGEQTNQANLWDVIKRAITNGRETVTVRNIFIKGTLQCVSVLERLSPKHYVIVFRIRNYDSSLNDVGSAMQYIDCTAVRGSQESPIYLNMGLADTKGLIASKEGLNPCHHQKIWTLKTNKTNIILKQYFK